MQGVLTTEDLGLPRIFLALLFTVCIRSYLYTDKVIGLRPQNNAYTQIIVAMGS